MHHSAKHDSQFDKLHINILHVGQTLLSYAYPNIVQAHNYHIYSVKISIFMIRTYLNPCPHTGVATLRNRDDLRTGSDNIQNRMCLYGVPGQTEL